MAIFWNLLRIQFTLQLQHTACTTFNVFILLPHDHGVSMKFAVFVNCKSSIPVLGFLPVPKAGRSECWCRSFTQRRKMATSITERRVGDLRIFQPRLYLVTLGSEAALATRLFRHWLTSEKWLWRSIVRRGWQVIGSKCLWSAVCVRFQRLRCGPATDIDWFQRILHHT